MQVIQLKVINKSLTYGCDHTASTSSQTNKSKAHDSEPRLGPTLNGLSNTNE